MIRPALQPRPVALAGGHDGCPDPWGGGPVLHPLNDVLAVARRHGTTTAADWAGVHVVTMRKLIRDHDPAGVRHHGHPSRADRLAWADRPGCTCPRCRPTTTAVTTPKIDRFLDEGYGPATVARIVGVDVELVRARQAERRRRRPAEWVSA